MGLGLGRGSVVGGWWVSLCRAVTCGVEKYCFTGDSMGICFWNMEYGGRDVGRGIGGRVFCLLRGFGDCLMVSDMVPRLKLEGVCKSGVYCNW